MFAFTGTDAQFFQVIYDTTFTSLRGLCARYLTYATYFPLILVDEKERLTIFRGDMIGKPSCSERKRKGIAGTNTTHINSLPGPLLYLSLSIITSHQTRTILTRLCGIPPISWYSLDNDKKIIFDSLALSLFIQWYNSL